MTAEEKKELVSFLRRGDKKHICKLAGVHETVMYAWISGRLKTSSIEPYVIQLANQRKKEFEAQTGESVYSKFIDGEIIFIENMQLKMQLQALEKELSKAKKLLSGKNRISRELFSSLKTYVKELEISPFHKETIAAKLDGFQSDSSFLDRYEKYADILNTINPLFSRSLDELYSGFSIHEKRMLSMIRLNLSIHEMSVILAVSENSVRENHQILRQKLKLDPEKELSDFINLL